MEVKTPEELATLRAMLAFHMILQAPDEVLQHTMTAFISSHKHHLPCEDCAPEVAKAKEMYGEKALAGFTIIIEDAGDGGVMIKTRQRGPHLLLTAAFVNMIATFRLQVGEDLADLSAAQAADMGIAEPLAHITGEAADPKVTKH